MSGPGTGEGVGDLMAEGVQDRLFRVIAGVVFSDLDPLRSVLAHAQLTSRFRPAEGPSVQVVLPQFVASDRFEFVQIHAPVLHRSRCSLRRDPLAGLQRL